MNTQKMDQVFAVIRIDGESKDQDNITVKEILPTMAEAVQEVERLNRLNASKGVRYILQATRYYPNGRQSKVAGQTQTGK